MRRRAFLAASTALLAGSRAARDAAAAANAGPAGATASTAGSLSTLTLVSTQSGTLPYLATVYPLQGTVPQGMTVASEDDPRLSASVLSRWPDGSAAVAVLAGEVDLTARSPRTVALRPAAATTARPLTPDHIGALISAISVEVAGLGSARLSGFAAPERIWWANAQVICCRYRAALDADLEAVVDVHAFASDRALVEVVVENARIDASAKRPPRPPTKSYGAAVVRINDVEIGNVAAPAAGQTYRSGRGGGRHAGGHEAFRAWYCSGWIGGDPAVEVTHDAAALQSHPLFYRCWRAAANDYRRDYENDAYEPWSAGRLNVPAMRSGGDIEGIGPLAQWDARYLQTGSRYARRAVVASALGALTCNINSRDAGSGRVPTHAQATGHTQQDGSWPRTSTEPAWELAHHPGVGLMAFLCRPSPVFIELAQKVAIWNATALARDGVFGFWSQVRGKAWGIRSLAHAIFLTPDGDPWKTPARASLAANARQIDAFRTSPNSTLGFVWYPAPAKCADFEARIEGMQQPLWEHHFLVLTLHAAERGKLLSGAQQALLKTVADWAALQPVRYVSEAAHGEWRLHNYLTTVGRAVVTPDTGDTLGSGVYAGPTFDALPTYPQNLSWFYRDQAPAESGAFLFIETNPRKNPNYRAWASAKSANVAGVSYASIFWAALTAAVERAVPGADTAWERVNRGITNLSSWSDGFIAEPRYNRLPRNL